MGAIYDRRRCAGGRSHGTRRARDARGCHGIAFDQERCLEQGDDLQKTVKRMTRAEFEAKYAHFWLIRELDSDESSPSAFNTVAWDSKRTISAGKKMLESGPGMAARMRHDPSRFAFYPLTKSGANPWAERILVGRASNNDIVLRHESVSKLHAYFEERQRGTLHLHDAKSANGTR